MDRRILKTLGFAMLTSSPAILAAPMKSPSKLPLPGETIIAVQNQINSQDEMKEFTAFINSLDVFPDHTNPEDSLDPSKPKKFYIPPVFQPSLTRVSVGNQEIADWGIKALSEIIELSKSFDLDIMMLNDLGKRIGEKRETLNKVQQTIAKTTDESIKENLVDYAAQLQAELVKLEDSQTKLVTEGGATLASVKQEFRDSIRNQVVLGLAQFGVSPTNAENTNLQSSDPAKMVSGMASIIARVSSGQFGIRQAIFESGYTDKQKKFIAAYKAARPDIQVVPLPTVVTYVKGAAQSSVGNEYSSEDAVATSVLYRGFNIGTNGRCGNTYTCNVVAEFPYVGARMTSLSKTGVVMFPVVFESDVTFTAPDFEGTVSCDFKNGWQAKGRSDVKDGAIIYDGDVYDKIKYDSFNDGSCNYSTTSGDKNSGAYHLIKAVHDKYLSLQYERMLKSEKDKAAYEKYVRSELDRHAKESQGGKKGVFDELGTWTSAFGGGWGAVASFAFGESRNFYWHTRVEDTHSYDHVKFEMKISESNMTATERFTYDAFPQVCWKRDDAGNSFMSACPDTLEYKKIADSDLGKAEKNCGFSTYESCHNDVNNAPVNEDGVIVDPSAVVW